MPAVPLWGGDIPRAPRCSVEVTIRASPKNNPDDPGLDVLRRTASLFDELSQKFMVLHRKECWETAALDVEPSGYITQLWRLDTCPDSEARSGA